MKIDLSLAALADAPVPPAGEDWGTSIARHEGERLLSALPAPAPHGEARDTPPTADREALARRVEQLVAGLVDQQAMPDGWWKPELAAVVAALRQEPKP